MKHKDPEDYPSILSEGCVHLFNPCIPDRIMRVLMSTVMQGCREKDRAKMRQAIDLLSKKHARNFHSDCGKFSHTGWAVPTPRAEDLIKQILDIIAKWDVQTYNPLGLDLDDGFDRIVTNRRKDWHHPR